jgi:superfamily I DNA/RNA helicase
METGNPDQFLGTFEFYPEEGKYHIDGHRACDISFWPTTTRKHDGRCPVCGKPLTLGVLYRVEELADRREGQKPLRSAPYFSIIQLKDILSEIFRVGPNSKKVKQAYQVTLNKLGSEFNILHNLDTVAIEQAGISLLPEAVERMRRHEINVIPGYDGQYGRVKIFKDHERAKLMGQQSLFKVAIQQPSESEPSPSQNGDQASQKVMPDPGIGGLKKDKAKEMNTGPQSLFSDLNKRQRQAVEHPDGRLLIVAGPGTGKTRTLTMRIAHLIIRKDVSPDNILAVTFTRKAAREMQQRLRTTLEDTPKMPLVATFHSLCFKILNDLKKEQTEFIVDEDERKVLIREAIKQTQNHGIAVSQKPQKILNRIIAAKQQILSPEDLTEPDNITTDARMLAEVYHSYQNLLSIQGLNDYEDLIFKVVRLLETDPKVCQKYRDRFQHIFVDEYQDLNHGQYRIIKALAPRNTSNRNLCVIGDPDQAIYGFRGADVGYFTRFTDDYPDTAVVQLTRNYRSTETILDASFQVIQDHRLHATEARTYSEKEGVKTIHILELASPKAEAQAIAGVIAQLVGGTGFHSIDTGQVIDANLVYARSYVDFAVLVRTHQQIKIIAEVFDQAGVPFQIASRQNSLKSWGLPELISVLKVVQNHGSDVDLYNSLQLFSVSINKNTADHFKSWCISKRLSQLQGLDKAKRFPVPGLSRAQQQKLIDFKEQLENIESRIGGMVVAEQLRYLSRLPALSVLVSTEPRSREAFNNLLALSEDYGNNIAEFLASAALDTDTDAYLPQAEKVSLMTMHAAKGLEFPVVFIAGCEKDLIPLNRQGAEPADPDEERRLFYVAMTRAMERLYLTRAKKRSVYGELLTRSLSPFVADIERRLKKDDSPKRKKKKKKDVNQKQLKLF